MKIKTILISLLLAVSAYAEQKVLVVICAEGKPKLGELMTHLAQGWTVVNSVQVTNADTDGVVRSQKSSYTTCIVYILDRKPPSTDQALERAK
jgi:hypothetical protein